MPDTEIGVACVQMEPHIGAIRDNVAKSIAKAEEAADQGATLVVLPELSNSGYVFESEQEALDLAEDVRAGPTIRAWSDIAARRHLYIVAGINERDGRRIYNSTVVIGPDGLLGLFRKAHLWDQENRFFTRGNLDFPVFDLPFGRLATFICYDGWFPESYRTCALKGADIICIPTNWVPMPDQPPNRDVMANTLVMAAAHTNSVFVAAADRIGIERGQRFLGCSLIVGPTGWPLAGPASADREEILLARIDLADASRARRLNSHNHLLFDRRTDLYRELSVEPEHSEITGRQAP